MKFGENLQKLRKGINLSQEQLAEELGVSRQAVSKWESGSSYPEMDKLIVMSNLFSCTLDDLVQKDVEVKTKSPIKNYDNYDNFYKKFALAMAAGVGIILFGLTMLLLMYNYLSEDSVIPIGIFMSCILVSVIIFIYYGLKMEEYNRLEKPVHTMDEYYQEFAKKFNLGITAGVGLCIFAVIILIFTSSMFGEDSTLPITMFMGLITIAVYTFVYCGIMRDKYESNNHGENKIAVKFVAGSNSENIKTNITEKVSSVIMLLATIIYLYLGFVESMWHPGWLVFVFGGILCAISEIIFD